MSNVRAYVLHITETQADLLTQALDFYERVGGLGQFGEVLDPWRFRCADENIEPARDLLDRVQTLLTGLPPNASHGIHSPKVPDQYRVAYDLHQVLRHRLAWDRHPEGGMGVWFYEPRQTGDHPLATIEQKPAQGWHITREVTDGVPRLSLMIDGRERAFAYIRQPGLGREAPVPVVNWSALGSTSPNLGIAFGEGLAALSRAIQREVGQ